MADEAFADALLAITRWAGYAGALGVIGASAFRRCTARAVHGRRTDTAAVAVRDLHHSLATLGLAAALILLSATLARLWAQTYAFFGPDERVDFALLLEVATELPPWSTGWQLQAGAAAASAMVLFLVRLTRGGWIGVDVAALAIAVTLPLTGHAVAQEDWYLLPIALQAGHVLGSGIWIGGLFMLVVTVVLPAIRSGRTQSLPLPGLVRTFSPLALTGAGLIAATGTATALLYLRAFADLWQTGYGQVLLLKVGLFAAVAAVGYVNWRHITPILGGLGGPHALRLTATLELAVAIMVLALTAILVGLPQPR